MCVWTHTLERGKILLTSRAYDSLSLPFNKGQENTDRPLPVLLMVPGKLPASGFPEVTLSVYHPRWEASAQAWDLQAVSRGRQAAGSEDSFAAVSQAVSPAGLWGAILYTVAQCPIKDILVSMKVAEGRVKPAPLKNPLKFWEWIHLTALGGSHSWMEGNLNMFVA